MKKILAIIIIVLSFSSCNNIQQNSIKTNSNPTYTTIEPLKNPSISIIDDSSINSNVVISGYEITIEELLPIIEAAEYATYLMDGGDDIFTRNGTEYNNYEGKDYYQVLESFDTVFSSENELSSSYLSSLKCYVSTDNSLLISQTDLANFTATNENIFDLSTDYKTIVFTGGIGSNPTFINNEFKIINRKKESLTIQNIAYYNEDNDKSEIIYEYNMMLEDGKWKFLNFERWY